jgi:hypothetical protein
VVNIKKVFKIIAAILFSGVLLYVSIKYTSHLLYPIRFLLRIPEAFALLWVWTKWIGRDMKQRKSKWRFKASVLHFGLMVLGLIEIIFLFRLMHSMGMVGKITDMQTVISSAEQVKSEFSVGLVIFELFFVPIVSMPALYFISHTGYYLFKLNIWSMQKSLQYFTLTLLLEDLVWTSLASIIR